MAARVLIGTRPDGAETGFWVSKPGFDAINDDRYDRAKFRFSSSFQGRRPLRIVAAGMSQTTAAIWVPETYGMEPMLACHIMVDGNTERGNSYVGNGQDGSGGSWSAMELYNKLVYPSGGGRYFVVRVTRDEGAVYGIRYLIAVF